MIERFTSAIPPGEVLITPTSPIEAPPRSALLDQPDYDQSFPRANALLWPFNELDAPAISIPCGRTRAGLPVGLQLVAPRGRDDDVLAAAALVEAAITSHPTPPSTEGATP